MASSQQEEGGFEHNEVRSELIIFQAENQENVFNFKDIDEEIDFPEADPSNDPTAGRKRLFSKELRCMMYGFGDDQNPYTESVVSAGFLWLKDFESKLKLPVQLQEQLRA